MLSVLDALKSSNDLNQWKARLFNIYGTHVATAIDIGGKMEMSSKFRSISSDAEDESSLSVAFSIGASAGSMEGGIKNSRDSAQKSGLQIDENTFKCFGGSEVQCGSKLDIAKWKASVRDSPAVISQKLAPLSAIVPAEYQAKVSAMTDAYVKWIKQQCPGGEQNTCYGHGQCSSGGTCMCNKGYDGSDCQTKIIPYDAKVTMGGGGKTATAYPCQTFNGQKYTGCWNLDSGPLKYKLKSGAHCSMTDAAPVEGTCVDFWHLTGSWGVGGSGAATCTSDIPGPNGRSGRRLLGRGGVGYMGRKCLLNGKETSYGGQPVYKNSKVVCMTNLFIVPGYKCASP